jgi:hypothetical protein
MPYTSKGAFLFIVSLTLITMLVVSHHAWIYTGYLFMHTTVDLPHAHIIATDILLHNYYRLSGISL